jgi:hypothetical protein
MYYVTVWDYDSGMNNDFIGYVEISVNDLFEKFKNNELVALKPPPKPHNQEAGSLRVVSITHYDETTTEGKVSSIYGHLLSWYASQSS